MKFNPVFITAAALLLGLAIGYSFTPQPPAPEPPPIATHAATPHSPTPIATIRFNYKPIGTPPITATLQLDLALSNAATGADIPWAKIWVNGLELPTGERVIFINFLGGEVKFIRVQVEADGFKAIDKILRMKILYNRRESLPLTLQPLQVN